jgi:hypothetical protein
MTFARHLHLIQRALNPHLLDANPWVGVQCGSGPAGAGAAARVPRRGRTGGRVAIVYSRLVPGRVGSVVAVVAVGPGGAALVAAHGSERTILPTFTCRGCVVPRTERGRKGRRADCAATQSGPDRRNLRGHPIFCTAGMRRTKTRGALDGAHSNRTLI